MYGHWSVMTKLHNDKQKSRPAESLQAEGGCGTSDHDKK